MRLILLLISFLIIGLLILFQLNYFDRYLVPIISPDNPQNINQQLENTQTQINLYNQTLQESQVKTENILKSLTPAQ